MLRTAALCLCLWLTLAARSQAAELNWDFSQVRAGQLPPGFRSTVSGDGKPGRWEVQYEDLRTLVGTVSSSRKPFLAQLDQDPTNEHFPLLVYEKERFRDFKLTTQFRTTAGTTESMAGIAFRIQDEKNYYLLRASTKDATFRFYRYVGGLRGELIGPALPIPSNTWHELSVECKGNTIICSLNGVETMSLTDATFSEGWIGYWTKSDSVSHFANTRITYTPLETLASILVRDALVKYPRLVDVKIFATPVGGGPMAVVAAKNSTDLGRPATQIERDVVAKDAIGYGKGTTSVTVTLPLQDRNGEAIAAVQLIMEAFKGQTEQNAIARAVPIVRYMQPRVRSAKDLLQ